MYKLYLMTVKQVTYLSPLWDLLLPMPQTPDRRDDWLIGPRPKEAGKVA